MQELNGYVKIFRKFRYWRWYSDIAVRSVFLECLLLANYKETTWKSEVLKPGQLVTGYASLANSLGLSIQQVRTAIKKLQQTGEISLKATNKYTIITVTKWEDYQVFDADVNKQITNEKQTDSNESTNNQQQRKNNKNNKNSNNSYVRGRTGQRENENNKFFVNPELLKLIESGEL